MSAASMTHCRPGITGKLLLILVTVPGGPAGRTYGWEWGAYGPSQAAHRDHRDVPAQAADLESMAGNQSVYLCVLGLGPGLGWNPVSEKSIAWRPWCLDFLKKLTPIDKNQ